MSDTKWRIEKITATHEANLNNPHAYPVGGWYCTSDPTCETDNWDEFYAATWTEAVAGVGDKLIEQAK